MQKQFKKTHHIRRNSKRKKGRVKTRHSKIEIAQKYARYPMFFSIDSGLYQPKVFYVSFW